MSAWAKKKRLLKQPPILPGVADSTGQDNDYATHQAAGLLGSTVSEYRAIKAALLKYFLDKSLELHVALRDEEDLETCVDMMFDMLQECRSIPDHIIASLSTSEKMKLDKHCQDAMQVVADTAERTLAPGEAPTTDLGRMGYANAIEINRLPFDDLGIRLRGIFYNMSNLWDMASNDPAILHSAKKVLRLCSGAESRFHCLDGRTYNLAAIDFASLGSRDGKKEVFNSVVLTLLCLARSHSAWSNAMLPTIENRRAVMLWDIPVRGTGDIVDWRKVVRWKGHQGASSHTTKMSDDQITQLQDLNVKMRLLHDLPSFALPAQAVSSAPQTMTPLQVRASNVLSIIKSAIAGRRFERGDLYDGYTDALCLVAETALTDLFLAAKKYFGISEEPSATTPLVFEPAVGTRRPPPKSDPEVERAW